MTVMAGTCSRCASGNHTSHMVSLGGICIGCACTVKVRGEDPPVEKRVDTLRRAASKARELADDVSYYPGPWSPASGPSVRDDDGVRVATIGFETLPKDRVPLATFLASWHPDVARAVADMLEEFARLDDQGIHPPTSVVTLAKHYLGEVS